MYPRNNGRQAALETLGIKVANPLAGIGDSFSDTLHNYGQLARGAGNYLAGRVGEAGNLAAGIGTTMLHGGAPIPAKGQEAPGAKYLRAMDTAATRGNMGAAQMGNAWNALGTAHRAQEPMGPFPGRR